MIYGKVNAYQEATVPLQLRGKNIRTEDVEAVIDTGFSGLSVLAVGGRFGSHGGVAWWAHIGGFVAGLILVKLFARQRLYRDEYRPW